MDIMTKVRVLWEKVAGITADVSAVDAKATATAATLAGILPRIPKDYSSTSEVNTGRKWIDGKDIFELYYSGTLPTITETSTQNLITDFESEAIIDADWFVNYSPTSVLKLSNNLSYSSYNKILSANSVTSVVSEKPFYLIVRYTKPDPVPAQADNETRKRKTTKKEEK